MYVSSPHEWQCFVNNSTNHGSCINTSKHTKWRTIWVISEHTRTSNNVNVRKKKKQDMASICRLHAPKSWTHKRENRATVATRCTACNKRNKIRLVVVGEWMNMQNTKEDKKNVVMQFKNRTMKHKKKRSAELLFNYSQKKMASIQIWGFLHAYARRLESHKASGVLQGGPRPLAQKPQTQRRFYCYYSGRYLYST